MLQLRVGVLDCVVIDAYRCPLEVLQVVFLLDEEDAVVNIFEPNFLLNFVGPVRRVVRPGTGPFASTPRITQLVKLEFATFVLQSIDGNERVRMPSDKSISSSRFTSIEAGSNHNEFSFVS